METPLKSSFSFDAEYMAGDVPLTEDHLMSDYENRRYAIAVAAGAGEHLY